LLSGGIGEGEDADRRPATGLDRRQQPVGPAEVGVPQWSRDVDARRRRVGLCCLGRTQLGGLHLVEAAAEGGHLIARVRRVEEADAVQQGLALGPPSGLYAGVQEVEADAEGMAL